MRKSNLLILLAFSTAAVVVVVLWLVRFPDLAAQDLDSLLAGKNGIVLEQLVIEYQQRQVVCRDRTVLKELTSILQRTEESGGGCMYNFTFTFATGRSYSVDGEAGGNSIALVIPSAHPVEGWWPTHYFTIPASVSDRLSQVMSFLDAPWEEVGGLLMTLTDDEPIHYTFDPSLSGRNPRGSRVAELTGI